MDLNWAQCLAQTTGFGSWKNHREFRLCSGAFGCLVYLDIDRDPISMTTLLMAIGFSVDFVAHITFHYYKSDIPNKRERVRHALASVAWPISQSGTSTMISIIVLAAVHVYMVQVLVKVAVLIVFLGMCHGLIVLPVVFVALPFKEARVSKLTIM
ncbi:unnamed protein product [Heligmosomoides polygyrus]|uniref:SSD domain-containing protein n=1 Tax=Heligmosomoides polygyrus TaxID=6339 RepID=A0A183GTG3_HELPZ|nr:unnamed protein product [Heligmosomoides polygyrus]